MSLELDSYKDWISLYNDKFQVIYTEEKTELRKLAMVYYAFKIEINNIKDSLNREFTEIKSSIKKRDYLNKCQNFVGLAQSEKFDDIVGKENKTPDTVPLKQIDCNETNFEEFLIESPNTSKFFKERSSSPKPYQNKTAGSPILNKNSFTKPKKKKSCSPSSITPISTLKVEKIPNLESSADVRTPKNCDDSNIMECSIVEDTPNLKSVKRTKPSILQLRKRKKSKINESKQGTTLTQMFFESKKEKKKIDSNMASMSISEMIKLLNENSGSETDIGSDGSDETVDLEPSKVGGNVPNNLRSFVENYDKIPVKKDDKCEDDFGVVRGKARKKLKGWSCNECQDYYEALNLPPDQLEKKKNECSRHRNRFGPREDTYEGFWDLTFGPTPKTQESEDSLIFNYKKT